MNTIVPMPAKAVAFTGLRRAELLDWPVDTTPLKDNEVAGRTLVSLISPGTEINWAFDKEHDKPATAGYAAVFEVDAVGSAVTKVHPGQRVFCLGQHISRQRRNEVDVVPLPDGLAPEEAVFARLMGVSWTTLITTTARPTERVVILGLGIIGNLAAQMFRTAGYRVTGIDPAEPRRHIATRCGIADVRPTAIGHADLESQVALAIDCSGHEQAVLDACRIVRKRGEVVLVGVPWKRRCDLQAFEILHAVFHRYVVLRSGWEWEVPHHPRDFTQGSIFGNAAAAMEWIAEKRVIVDGLYEVVSPCQAQSAYEDLMHQRGEHLSMLFDWRNA